MLVRLDTGAGLVDLALCIHDPAATVADLLEALDRPGQPVSVDGRTVSGHDRLDRIGLGDGAVVGIDPPGAVVAALALTVTSGFDVGRQATLPAGRWVLGRPDPRWRHRPAALAVIDDPRLLSAHAGLHVDRVGGGVIRPLARAGVVAVGPDPTLPRARGGRWWRRARQLRHRRVSHRAHRSLPGWETADAAAEDPAPAVAVGDGSRLRLGPVEVVLHRPVPPVEVPPPAPGSPTRPLHRRPRAALPADPQPVTVPEAPSAPPAVTPVGVLGVAASVAVGAAMVVLLHSWAYGAFALLGPVLLVANALDGRRRRRRVRRAGTRQRRRDLARLAADLAATAGEERHRRAQLHPGPVGVLDRCTGSAPTCWDRRAADADAYAVRLGTGDGPWSPPVRGGSGERPHDVAEVLAGFGAIPQVALGCRLDPASPIAIVGPRTAALALARSIVVQATVDHGPVDLGVAVLTDIHRRRDWRWTAWLPHTRQDDCETLLADRPAASETVAGHLLGPRPIGSFRRTVVVIDDPEGLTARRSGARTVLRAATDPERQLVPLVLVTDALDVPAVCAIVLHVDDHGRLDGPPWITSGSGELVGVGPATADEVARRLCRLDDPELEATGRELPVEVALAGLLSVDPFDGAALASTWADAGADPPPMATIGQAADGPLVVDLAGDGPHALVAGTTGSGKSELLRTLVTSLAIASSPAQVTFVLIDFKGGSAFDACARLPHTTGIVTDLDGHVAARALRCLEAELRHREQRLRQVGAADLTAFRATPTPDGPLPRLVVVVDEFATLAAELPDFVDALVGIAQRGRSLGVHLVLATQRPAGAVSDHIRANTGLRVALRVHDAADSRDVIDDPAAADLPRQRAGRALARLGPGELVGFQTARVTGCTGALGRVTVGTRPFAVSAAAPPSASPRCPGGQPAAATDLERIVDAATEAWVQLGGAPPRRPWPDPLPEVVERHHPLLTSTHRASELVLGLADDPDHQRHVPFAWDLDAGPLLAIGLPGSGTTTLAAVTVLGAARRWSPDEFHVHVIDLGRGGLRPLAGLAHVGAVVAGDDRERQRRLLAELATDLAARRKGVEPGDGTGRPRRLLVVDGLAGLRAAWDDVEPTGTWNHLLDLLAHGPAVGMATVLTAAGIHGVPHRILAACHQRLGFRLADRSDHAALGISPASVPSLNPGRALAADRGQLVQVTWPGADLRAAVEEVGAVSRRTRARARPPDPVAVLPDELAWADVPEPHGHLAPDGTLVLAVGLTDEGLVPACLELPPGGAALVVGPPRSGRTTALRTLAEAARATPEVVVVILTPSPPRWPDGLGRVAHPDDPDLAEVFASLDGAGAPLLLLVDDADQTADDHPVLTRLLARRSPARRVVAAARADRVRGAYGHWLREAQADRTGLLLHPDLDVDGDLLGIRLPRRAPLPLRTGRGWITDAHPARLCQIVRTP